MVGEWDHRELCSDGACVGVIGPDGTCKVCGRAAPNWGEERKRGLLTGAGELDDADNEATAADVPAESAGGEVWQDRALCPDGSCIGLIGPDGHCKVCGSSWPGMRPGAAEPDDDEPDGDDDEADGELASAAADLAAVVPAGDVAALTPAPGSPVTDEELGEQRRLCPDGACVGVIGPDGTCKLCGAEGT